MYDCKLFTPLTCTTEAISREVTAGSTNTVCTPLGCERALCSPPLLAPCLSWSCLLQCQSLHTRPWHHQHAQAKHVHANGWLRWSHKRHQANEGRLAEQPKNTHRCINKKSLLEFFIHPRLPTATQHSTAQHSTAQHSTAQHSTAQQRKFRLSKA